MNVAYGSGEMSGFLAYDTVKVTWEPGATTGLGLGVNTAGSINWEHLSGPAGHPPCGVPFPSNLPLTVSSPSYRCPGLRFELLPQRRTQVGSANNRGKEEYKNKPLA